VFSTEHDHFSSTLRKLTMSTQAMPISGAKPAAAPAFNTAFIIAWLFCLLFYFMEYAVRAAPSVMLPELTAAFGLTTLGLSSLIGLYYYSYAAFGIVAGASVDRWGAKYTVPAGVLILPWALRCSAST
jgi:sugar phosphate permease